MQRTHPNVDAEKKLLPHLKTGRNAHKTRTNAHSHMIMGIHSRKLIRIYQNQNVHISQTHVCTIRVSLPSFASITIHLPGASQTHVVRKDGCSVDIVMAMESIDAIYERNSQPCTQCSLLQPIHHIHPLCGRCSRNWTRYPLCGRCLRNWTGPWSAEDATYPKKLDEKEKKKKKTNTLQILPLETRTLNPISWGKSESSILQAVASFLPDHRCGKL
jgi:hypothetical protein